LATAPANFRFNPFFFRISKRKREGSAVAIRHPLKPILIPWFLLLFFMEIRDSEFLAYFSGKLLGNFSMSRHCLHRTVRWIHPKRMGSSFSFEVATVPTQMPQEDLPLHQIATTSRIASSGNPRMASSRRSSSSSEIAAAKLALHSSIVLPCPFAPGTSGQ